MFLQGFVKNLNILAFSAFLKSSESSQNSDMFLMLEMILYVLKIIIASCIDFIGMHKKFAFIHYFLFSQNVS